MTPTTYAPAQRRVIELLGRSDDDAAIEPAVIDQLRDEIEERLRPTAELVPEGEQLWVGKSALRLLDGCEAQWRAVSLERFRWSIPAATGTVAHKAIELACNWRGPSEPSRMVDDALARIVDDDTGLAAFVRSLSTVDLAELRSEVVAQVTSFEECFPPLRPQWRPVLEGRIRVPLLGGRIVLSGRPDLTLGRATHGGKVIIDLKTGQPQAHHLPELRFYALLDTLKLGVAPRRIATFHLDAGRPLAHRVDEGTLRAAAERVVRGATAMAEIRARVRPAGIRPGSSCRWCPARPGCEAGVAWQRAAEDGELDASFWWYS